LGILAYVPHPLLEKNPEALLSIFFRRGGGQLLRKTHGTPEYSQAQGGRAFFPGNHPALLKIVRTSHLTRESGPRESYGTPLRGVSDF